MTELHAQTFGVGCFSRVLGHTETVCLRPVGIVGLRQVGRGPGGPKALISGAFAAPLLGVPLPGQQDAGSGGTAIRRSGRDAQSGHSGMDPLAIPISRSIIETTASKFVGSTLVKANSK